MTIPANGTSGQNVSIPYTVHNLTTTPALGDWYDSLYLTPGVTFDPNAQLLGRVHHIGDVAGLGSYTETLTAPLPNLADGGYHIVVEVDSRDLVSDSNRSNNTGISTNAFHVSVPLLTIGVPITGTITEGQDIYYRMVVPPGQDLTIAAISRSRRKRNSISVIRPCRTVRPSIKRRPDLSDLTPNLFLPTPQGGSYYLLLHGREGAARPANLHPPGRPRALRGHRLRPEGGQQHRPGKPDVGGRPLHAPEDRDPGFLLRPVVRREPGRVHGLGPPHGNVRLLPGAARQLSRPRHRRHPEFDRHR